MKMTRRLVVNSKPLIKGSTLLFGLELECLVRSGLIDGMIGNYTSNGLPVLKYWGSKSDASISSRPGYTPAEFVTEPLLYEEVEEALAEITTRYQNKWWENGKANLISNSSCGFHIHIGLAEDFKHVVEHKKALSAYNRNRQELESRSPEFARKKASVMEMFVSPEFGEKYRGILAEYYKKEGLSTQLLYNRQYAAPRDTLDDAVAVQLRNILGHLIRRMEKEGGTKPTVVSFSDTVVGVSDLSSQFARVLWKKLWRFAQDVRQDKNFLAEDIEASDLMLFARTFMNLSVKEQKAFGRALQAEAMPHRRNYTRYLDFSLTDKGTVEIRFPHFGETKGAENIAKLAKVCVDAIPQALKSLNDIELEYDPTEEPRSGLHPMVLSKDFREAKKMLDCVEQKLFKTFDVDLDDMYSSMPRWTRDIVLSDARELIKIVRV